MRLMIRPYAAVAAVVFICISLVDAPSSMSQNASLEYQVKATFLYNFAKFVEWPEQAFPRPDTPFTICLAGDPFEGYLEKIVQGETLNGRPLTVRRVAVADNVRSCQLVYVSGSEAQRVGDIVSGAANAPVLTVGENDEFINRGGIIRFIESGRSVRFEINPDAAKRAMLRVSSRLLRLADIVKPRQRAENR